MSNHENFLQAIQEKKVVTVQFNSQEKGLIERTCIPFDFGPSRRNLKVNPDRYHFYDLDSPEGRHILSILPEQIVTIAKTNTLFDPADYIAWDPDWFVPRNWGIYS
jgi:hypothetical protein